MRVRQTSLVAYISVAHALVHTIEVAYGVLLLRIQDEFGVGLFALGVVANVFAFAFGFGALPSGVLVDRLGTQRVLFNGFSLAAVAALLVAVAPNPVLLGVFLALLGLGIGLYHPAGISLIAQVRSQASGRGMALGWHGVAGNLGIAAAPALAIGVAAGLGDWRWAYVVLAMLALAAAVSLRLVRLEHADSSAAVPAPVSEQPPARAEVASSVTRASRLSAFAPLLLVYGVFILNGFVYRGSITFLPAHMEERLSISAFGLDEGSLTAALITAALLAGAFGQLFGGALSERFRLERIAVPLTLSMIPFLFLMGVSSGIALVIFSALFVFANFSGQPVYTGLIADYSPRQALGRSYGISFFAAFGIGSVAASAGGFFADTWSTGAVFVMLAFVAVATLALAIAIWRLAEGRARVQGREREGAAGRGGG